MYFFPDWNLCSGCIMHPYALCTIHFISLLGTYAAWNCVTWELIESSFRAQDSLEIHRYSTDACANSNAIPSSNMADKLEWDRSGTSSETSGRLYGFLVLDEVWRHVSTVVLILEVLVPHSSVILLRPCRYHNTRLSAGPLQTTQFDLSYSIFVDFKYLKCVFANQLILFRMFRHFMSVYNLTRWARVTHICIGNLTIISSDDGLSPGRREAIIWTDAGILLNGSLGTTVREICIDIHNVSFKKMHLTISFEKWQPSCLGLNVFKPTSWSVPHSSCWSNKTRQTCHNRL